MKSLLERARTELGVDLCFVGEMSGGRRVFRFVDGDRESFGVDVGLIEPADATYCQRMLDGVLPSIKLDIVFTRGIDQDPIRRSLTAALVSFAREIDATIVAEGIETAEELATLRDFGVEHGQGYYLGRPATIEDIERR